MLLAVFLMATALLVVAVMTQRYGYRLGGTITLGVLVIYTLKDFIMFPVFILSTVIAYLGLALLKRRTLIYGRQEIIATIVVGSAIPLAILLFLSTALEIRFRGVVFIGSILPGLAAFNYHQLKPEYRRIDAVVALGMFAGLFGIGWLLVNPVTARAIGSLTPPVLFAQTADVAVFKGATVPTTTEPIILSRPALVVILLVGMGVAEAARGVFGLRIGIISIALLAVYAIGSAWLVGLYVVTLAVTFLLLELLNGRTLLYGRVLIGLGTAVAVVLVLPLAVYTPIVRGLSAFFVGILAGVNAYNRHVTPAVDRRTQTALTVAVFLPILALTVYVGTPLPRALLSEITPLTGLALGCGFLIALGAALFWHVDTPSSGAVYRDSILSGGDGT